jgi:hypothetical protein
MKNSQITRKQLKSAMPSKTVDNGTYLSWNKSRGHAGSNSIQKTVDKLKLLGFKSKKTDSFNHPDGSVVSNSVVYADKLGNELSYTMSYGSTSDSNYFSMTLKLGSEYVS